jgi:hypothetical protein
MKGKLIHVTKADIEEKKVWTCPVERAMQREMGVGWEASACEESLGVFGSRVKGQTMAPPPRSVVRFIRQWDYGDRGKCKPFNFIFRGN